MNVTNERIDHLFRRADELANDAIRVESEIARLRVRLVDLTVERNSAIAQRDALADELAATDRSLRWYRGIVWVSFWVALVGALLKSL